MSIKKQYLKTRPVCKVTFRLSKEAAGNADRVHLVGDFNEWDHTATPMRKLQNGGYKVVLDLEPENDYQFRYLIDGEQWENDWDADTYAPTPYGDTENSVVSV